MKKEEANKEKAPKTKEQNKEETKKEEEKSPLQLKDERIVELSSSFQRLQAEFANYKRRSDEEKKEFKTICIKNFLEHLIPAIDHFELALKHECSDKNYATGMQMIYDLIINSLKAEQIEVICPGNEAFDPNKHEAAGTKHDSNLEENTIIEVLQKGYRVKEKTIRLAKVIVNKKE